MAIRLPRSLRRRFLLMLMAPSLLIGLLICVIYVGVVWQLEHGERERAIQTTAATLSGATALGMRHFDDEGTVRALRDSILPDVLAGADDNVQDVLLYLPPEAPGGAARLFVWCVSHSGVGPMPDCGWSGEAGRADPGMLTAPTVAQLWKTAQVLPGGAMDAPALPFGGETAASGQVTAMPIYHKEGEGAGAGDIVGMAVAATKFQTVSETALRHWALIVAVIAYALALPLFVALPLGRMVVKPVEDLARSARRVAADEADAPRSVESDPANAKEIADMINGINVMLARLREKEDELIAANEGLEDAVEARTEELEAAKRSLESTNKDLEAAVLTAEEANRAKSTFLANMNHEIRNPLNGIIQRAEYLQEIAEDEGGLDEFEEEAKAIVNRSRHLLNIINRVLDLSKIESGAMEPDFSRRAVQEIVDEVHALAEPQVLKNGNAFVVDLGEDALGDMTTDVTWVIQCVLNLLTNAAKFTKEGEVRLEVRPIGRAEAEKRLGRPVGAVDEWLAFRVADTGIGMTPEELARVFEPFAQANESISASYGGTGLGLSLTQKLCHVLGGDISMASEKGVGTATEILLPRESGEADAMPAPTALNLHRDVKRILVVDDDDAFHKEISQVLSPFAAEVTHARTVDSGIMHCRSIRPDVVVLDILMPLHDGWRFLQLLRQDQELASTPVLIVTETEYDRRAEEMGATSFFTKPLDAERRDRFLQLVSALLGGRELRRVLVVDDEFETRRNLRRSFSERGVEVVEAENGVVALKALADGPLPDLTVMDLVMPEMDGFETIARIRARPEWRDLPIIVLSSKDLSREERQTLGAATDALLDKNTVSIRDVASVVAGIANKAETAA